MTCKKCAGKGKIQNPAWLDEVDRMMDSGNYPDFHSASRQASRHDSEYISCPDCNGSDTINNKV